MAVDRRELIKTGWFGAVSFISGSYAKGNALLTKPSETQDFTYEETTFIRAVAQAIIGLEKTTDHDQILNAVVEGVAQTIRLLPPLMQDEARLLLAITSHTVFRLVVARIWDPWEKAPQAEIDIALVRFRTSSIDSLRLIYESLHQLITASWYANPASWEAIGYPGPPLVAREER